MIGVRKMAHRSYGVQTLLTTLALVVTVAGLATAQQPRLADPVTLTPSSNFRQHSLQVLSNTENIRLEHLSPEEIRAMEIRGPSARIVLDSTTVTITLIPWTETEVDRLARRYEARFEGAYAIRHLDDPEDDEEPQPTVVQIFFPYPSNADTLPDTIVTVDGEEPEDARYTLSGVSFTLSLLPGETFDVRVTYRAFGSTDYTYTLAGEERLKKLDVTARVAGTLGSAPVIPAETALRPSSEPRTDGEGWAARWQYENLLTRRDITVAMPAPPMVEDLGDHAGALTRAALGAMLLFLAVLALGSRVREADLKPADYAVAAIGVAFMFPLIVYLSRALTIPSGFVIGLVVIALVVVDGLRRRVGLNFALSYGGFGLIVGPALLAAAVVFPHLAGLMLSTVGLLMIGFATRTVPVLVRVREQAREAEPIPAGPERPEGLSAESSSDLDGQHFCTHCGREIGEEFGFCPSCGREVQRASHCKDCGHELCPTCHDEQQHCPHCGSRISQDQSD